MEFHNIFGRAHGKSKLRDDSSRDLETSVQTSILKQEMKTTKNRTQHDQGSLKNNLPVNDYFGFCTGSLLKGTPRSQRGIILHSKNYPSLVSRNW